MTETRQGERDEQTVGPSLGSDAVRIVWDVLTSPRTLMVNGVILGLLLALGTVIPQGADHTALLALGDYATARAVQTLGVHDLLVSWPRPKPVGNPLRCRLAGDGPVEVDGESVWPSDHAAVVAEFASPDLARVR